MHFSTLPAPRQPAAGMGMAVAKRTVFRKSDQDDWQRVAERVARGNTGLVDSSKLDLYEFEQVRDAIGCGLLLTSGRHLQHGDKSQRSRNEEVFVNCSTAATSFLLFYLLLNGSGVGRSYDDRLMVVDWAKAPRLTLVLSYTHPDYPREEEAAQAFLRTIRPDAWTTEHAPLPMVYGLLHTQDHRPVHPGVYRFVVPDSREGWAQAMELYETITYTGSHDELVLDFSGVRAYGMPIGGMQDRPASGPLSLMRAFLNIDSKVVAQSKRGIMMPWEQAMRVDHHLSEEVQVGGARRAARMSTKDWHDPEILKFIAIKSQGGLWTSNNSLMVDAEFWHQCHESGTRAQQIFVHATENAYANGEPGFINGDALYDARHGLDRNLTHFTRIGSRQYQLTQGAQLINGLIAELDGLNFATITNPCVTADTEILTDEGPKKVADLLGQPFIAVVDNVAYSASGFWCSGVKPVALLTTMAGHSARMTYDQEVQTPDGWKPANLLRFGDEILLPNGGKTIFLALTPHMLEPVYDCMVDKVHCFNANGLLLHNCGEIPLHVMAGFCTIADFAPLFGCPVPFDAYLPGQFPAAVNEQWDHNILAAVQLGVRFLMRVNLMDSLYRVEVERTNRIGIGPTGLHEYAWLRFGLDFHDLLDDKKSAPFWNNIGYWSRMAKLESNYYADLLRVNPPITVTTCKPAGTTSKLFGVSEGAHLPARRRYLRWVQFRGVKTATGEWEATADSLLAEYEHAGYPVRQLKSFPGMSIVGFPTETLITRLGMGERLVTAIEATPQQQYAWLRKLEKFWLGEERGNQISYTLKVPTNQFTLDEFRAIMLENQPTIRCCSVLPMQADNNLTYEYLPEQDISNEVYENLTQKIAIKAQETIDLDALRCDNGVCPL